MYTSKWGKNQNWQAFDADCSYNPKEVQFAFELFHLWCTFVMLNDRGSLMTGSHSIMASCFGFLLASLWNEKLAFVSQHLAQVSFVLSMANATF